MLEILAHATEHHTEETSQLEHVLASWWFGLGAYALFIYVVGWALKDKMSLATRLSFILGASLIIGLVFYRWTPALSGVAIVVGFGLALFLGLGTARN